MAPRTVCGLPAGGGDDLVDAGAVGLAQHGDQLLLLSSDAACLRPGCSGGFRRAIRAAGSQCQPPLRHWPVWPPVRLVRAFGAVCWLRGDRARRLNAHKPTLSEAA